MRVSEARKLEAGDRVIWPEGANACKQTYGTVVVTPEYGKHIVWDDGGEDITSTSDDYSMNFVKLAQHPNPRGASAL